MNEYPPGHNPARSLGGPAGMYAADAKHHADEAARDAVKARVFAGQAEDHSVACLQLVTAAQSAQERAERHARRAWLAAGTSAGCLLLMGITTILTSTGVIR